MITLRPSQQEALDFVMSAKLDNIALLCPTAFGKGHLAKAISDASSGERVAIITYSNVLVRQFLGTFPIPFLIGAKHYPSMGAYANAQNDARHSKVVLFNPASYMNYARGEGNPPFDIAVIDEADSCIGVFELQMGTTFIYNRDYATEHTVAHTVERFDQEFADNIRKYPGKYWFAVERKKVKGKEITTVTVRDIYLRNFRRYLPERVVLMSGTLFKSHVKQLIDGQEYDYYEGPSPIPVEQRPIDAYTSEPFDGTTEGLIEMAQAVLRFYPERPAVFHCSYRDTREITASGQMSGYLTKDDKLQAFRGLVGTEEALLAAGATTGLDLVGDACRLNVILRGAFQCLGSELVQKRLVQPGGEQWYTEETLRQVIQASGRACRTPTDYGRTVIADVRVANMVCSHAHNLPKYFVDALRYRTWQEKP